MSENEDIFIMEDACTDESKIKRKSFEFKTSVPNECGRCVSMIEFKGNIYLATEYVIFVLTDDNTFKPIEFEEVKKEGN